jgi:hypothetical protein
MKSLRFKIPDENDRDYFIVKNLLFAFTYSDKIAMYLRERFYSNSKYNISDNLGNIFICNAYRQDGSDIENKTVKINSNSVDLGDWKNMKFDVVIGNPPYTDDVYLDFVMLGHKLSKQYDIWITPAKWQAKDDDSNKSFRSFITPYISKLVMFKSSVDVFDIMEGGGICYYLVSKNKCRHYIKCKSKFSKYFNSDYELHSEQNLILLPNNIVTILDKCGKNVLSSILDFKQSKYIKNTNTGNNLRLHYDDVEILQGDKVCGYLPLNDLFSNDKIDYYKCYTNIMPGAGVIYLDRNGTSLGLNVINKALPHQVPKGSYPCLIYFDTDIEANSFISYCNTKFTKFLHFCGICGTTITSEFWRFVPDQEFNKIFEDKPLDGYTPDQNGEYKDNEGKLHCSLYVKYKLTDDEIKL